MTRFGTSVAVSVVALLASGTAALAQDSGWAGYYVGAGLSDVGGLDGQVEATVDPALDPRIFYDTFPAGRTYTVERNLDRESTFNIKAGRLFESGAWVWGVEASLTGEGPDRQIAFGPEFGPDSRGRAREPLAGGGIPIPGGFILTSDELIGSIDLGREVSLRGRIGHSVGDRVLLSAFAGPSIMRTDLRVRQNSLVLTNLIYAAPPPRQGILQAQTQGAFSVDGKNLAWTPGVVVGASIDIRLSDDWRLNGEASLARYEQIEATAPVYRGSGSRFSYEPELYAGSLSLIRRF